MPLKESLKSRGSNRTNPIGNGIAGASTMISTEVGSIIKTVPNR